MRFSDLMAQTLRSTRSRSLESVLIVFAIALGVGVVTAMLALILNGLEKERSLSQSQYARELILVSRDEDYRGFFETGKFNPLLSTGNATDKPFKFEPSDLETVRKACPAIQYAYVTNSLGVGELGSGDDSSRSRELDLMGVSREFIDAAGLKLLVGSWPTGKDFREHNNLILLSEWYARERFEKKAVEVKPSEKLDQTESPATSTDPKQPVVNIDGKTPQPTLPPVKPFDLKDVVGKEISGLKIIGVFSIPNQSPEFASQTQPFGAKGITTFGERGYFTSSPLTDLKFLAREDQFDAAREQLSTYALRRWGEGAAVRSASTEITANLSTARNAALVTVLFASGGLVIAALNITNLMLARVLGRTRTIGISSALGASSRTIFTLFLTESLVLGLLGGLLGILLARGIVYGLEVSLRSASQYTSGLDLTLQPLHFAIGLLTALAISLLFGAYPAWMAAKIRPSEALRG